MNHTQRQLIKEAYQEGYYQALYEESWKQKLGKFIGGRIYKLFKRADDVASDAAPIGKPTPYTRYDIDGGGLPTLGRIEAEKLYQSGKIRGQMPGPTIPTWYKTNPTSAQDWLKLKKQSYVSVDPGTNRVIEVGGVFAKDLRNYPVGGMTFRELFDYITVIRLDTSIFGEISNLPEVRQQLVRIFKQVQSGQLSEADAIEMLKQLFPDLNWKALGFGLPG